MNFYNKVFILATGLLFASFVNAQETDKQLLKKGMWRDSTTNLIWMRCVVGQKWNGQTCIGEGNGNATWGRMVSIIDALKFGGYSDWRLPSIEDLANIRKCVNGFASYEMPIPSNEGGEITVKKQCDGSHSDFALDESIFPNHPEVWDRHGDSIWSSYWSATQVRDVGTQVYGITHYGHIWFTFVKDSTYSPKFAFAVRSGSSNAGAEALSIVKQGDPAKQRAIKEEEEFNRRVDSKAANAASCRERKAANLDSCTNIEDYESRIACKSRALAICSE